MTGDEMFAAAQAALVDAMASVRSAMASLQTPTSPPLSTRDGLAKVRMLDALNAAYGNLEVAARARRLAMADAEVRARG